MLRAAPAGEERSAPHYTVSVSSQHHLEIVLPTLPEFQVAAVSRECFSQFFPPRNRSGAESLATPSGVSRAATSVVCCQSTVSGHRSSSSRHTRGQSRESSPLGFLSRLFNSVETTAKCISLGPADCRERLSHSVWCSAAAF